MSKVNPIPPGHHTVTPSLTVRDAASAIDFYKRAFGAVERGAMKGPGGLIVHAEILIGDSIVFVNDEMPGMGNPSPQKVGATTVGLHIYTEDCDSMYKRAIEAGATETMPLADQFWGDRYGQLTDPFGHVWGIGTHKENLTEDEIAERMKATMGA
jgi:uncharacterized glyoxalase superfamily protein PhnB